jgi:uncharacterized protein YcbK (DUF882 family)
MRKNSQPAAAMLRVPPADLARRRLLKAALLAASGVIAARYAGRVEAATESRGLALFNTHTGESLEIDYFADGAYVPAALSQLNHVLRDHRTNEQGVIDPALFDVLHQVAQAAHADPSFEVISGFRSASSNELLRAQGSGGVARNSLHLKGMAIDVRLLGCGCERLSEIGLKLACGGVGYYPKSDFVHLDTGRVRSWRG